MPDPTLNESALITRVKTDRDSDALLSLVHRHSGIYFNVVNGYASSYPNVIKARDMDDDKLFNLYQFILAYDPTRGMKLSTYIGERTDYLCRSMLKKDARNPISPGTYSATGAMMFDTDEDTFHTSDGQQVTLEDESETSRVAEMAEHDLSLEDIRYAAEEVCHDARFAEILKYRHLGPEHQQMSWRDIGRKVGLSHEGARKLYTHNLELVKAHLHDSP